MSPLEKSAEEKTSGEEEDAGRKNNSLVDSLAPIQMQLRSRNEEDPFLKELMQGGRELDQLYEASKSSTYKLKETYETIKNKERIVNLLHNQYYNALVEKKFHEEDRDKFFKEEKELEEMKKLFIENSQKYAYDNLKYVEYNQRFCKERENQICTILKEADERNQQISALKAECNSGKRELITSQTSYLEQRKKADMLEKEKLELKKDLETLTAQRDEFKAENDLLSRVKARLTDENGRLHKNISGMMQKLRQVAENNKELEIKSKKMKEKNDDLEMKFSQLMLALNATKENLEMTKEKMRGLETRYTDDKENLSTEMADLANKLKRSQTQCYKVMLKNQNLHQRLKRATHNVETVQRDKIHAILHEQSVKKRNVQLTEEKLSLISEVVELKHDFRRDQRRISSSHRVNRKLRSENDTLRNKIVLLKENRNAVALLEDAEELREVTQEKFTSRRHLNPHPPQSAPSCSSFAGHL